MKYRQDNDLAFLARCTDDDFSSLVHCLIYDTDGKKRISESLSSSDEYKKYGKKYSKYWQEIAMELQLFGGNTILNRIRGYGILYHEILSDVCEKVVPKFNGKDLSVEKMEDLLLTSILDKSVREMTPEKLKELGMSLNVNNIANFTPEILVALAQTIFRLGGVQSYQLTLIIANSVSKALFSQGAAMAGGAAVGRVVGILAGPIGFAITGVWTAIDLAGPAYRVTIPACIYVALLRKKSKLDMEKYKEELNKAFDIDDL